MTMTLMSDDAMSTASEIEMLNYADKHFLQR